MRVPLVPAQRRTMMSTTSTGARALSCRGQRPIRICILGDELSGLATAYFLQQRSKEKYLNQKFEVFVVGFKNGSARRCGVRSDWTICTTGTTTERGMYSSILTNRAGRDMAILKNVPSCIILIHILIF